MASFVFRVRSSSFCSVRFERTWIVLFFIASWQQYYQPEFFYRHIRWNRKSAIAFKWWGEANAAHIILYHLIFHQMPFTSYSLRLASTIHIPYYRYFHPFISFWFASIDCGSSCCIPLSTIIRNCIMHIGYDGWNCEFELFIIVSDLIDIFINEDIFNEHIYNENIYNENIFIHERILCSILDLIVHIRNWSY